MNPDETPPEPADANENVADRNVGRLLADAYEPEMPDPAFVQKATAAMLAAATARAAPPVAARPSGTASTARRLIGWTVAAALLIGVGLLLGNALWDNPPGRPAGETAESPSPHEPKGAVPVPAVVQTPRGGPIGSTGLIARAREQQPAAAVLAVGQSLETTGGQRRRVGLPDGSVLYLNGDTAVVLDRPRHVTVRRGEVYVEVSPAAEVTKTDAGNDAQDTGPKFVVATPDRQITALGTKFNVRVTGHGTRVVVTQGKVQVSGMRLPLWAGQQLDPRPQGQPEDVPPVSAAPRASHVVDWTRELMASVHSPLVPESKHTGGPWSFATPTARRRTSACGSTTSTSTSRTDSPEPRSTRPISTT